MPCGGGLEKFPAHGFSYTVGTGVAETMLLRFKDGETDGKVTRAFDAVVAIDMDTMDKGVRVALLEALRVFKLSKEFKPL